MVDPLTQLGLFLVALGAAIVNGAIGYGFSSIVTPVALLWVTNLVLNPALVAVEVAVNVTLLVRERRFLPETFGRSKPVIYGLLPGVIVGTVALALVGTSAPNTVKLVVYGTLLPLVLIQLIGLRRPIRSERTAGPLLGAGIGFLYSLTTISGPPLAIFWRNQGMSQGEFRCAMATIRTAEASMTLGTYLVFQAAVGTPFYTSASLSLIPVFLIAVVIGIPIGTLLLRSFSREYFARVIMAVDGYLVSFGLGKTLQSLGVVSANGSYAVIAVLFAIITGVAFYALREVTRTDAGPPLGPTRTGLPTPVPESLPPAR